jgi:pimeloyl-ACP methyl ester carboxylesterase
MTVRSQVTLVLLPGLDGTDVFFRPLLKALPSWVTPIVVQYPQEGRNDYEQLFEIVSAAVGNLCDYWILGWSFSGPLALRLAAQRGHHIRGVILCASFVRAPRRALAWCRFAAVGPIFSIVRVARRLPAFFSARRETWDDKAETWTRVSAATLARRIRAALSIDARETLSRCHSPIVYLASSRDVMVPRWNADEIVRHSPSTRIVVIEGSHMGLYTNPTVAATTICDVLHMAVPQCGD